MISGNLSEKGQYHNGKKNGKWEYYNFGLQYREISYKNGKYDGSYKIYEIQDGEKVLSERRYYADGDRSGIYERYLNGKIYSKTGYMNGKKDGVFISYMGDTPSIVGEYFEGEKTGKWTYYLEAGVVLRIENYKNGKRHGICQECYHRNSKKRGLEIDYVVETNYIDGLIDGEFPYEEFDKKTKTTIKGSFINNKREGLWQHFKCGELISQDYYENGKLVSTIKSNIPYEGKKLPSLQQILNIMKSKFLKLKKKEVKTDSFGDCFEEFEEIDGKKNGSFKQFDCNGHLIEEGQYLNDKREGLWKRYDEDGSLSAEGIFVNGVVRGIVHEYFDGELSSRVFVSGKVMGTESTFYENYRNGEIAEQGIGNITNDSIIMFPLDRKEVHRYRHGKPDDY